MKNFNDTTGNRIRDLPACNAVPQPTALLCTSPELKQYLTKFSIDIPHKFSLQKVENFRLSNLRKEILTAFIRGFPCHHHHHHHPPPPPPPPQVVCLTTDPHPLPQRVLHKGRSIME